ncbi:MAG: hypothetical protein JW774_09085, partial [Candidatus Aureabacteria bacterium]|nr:hypothetical protein [Candidatus Auribacterota bacterium]
DINDLLLGIQNQLKATGLKILLYTGPRDNSFDKDWDERFRTLSGDSRYWVLSTAEITTEMEKSRWKDIHDFKNWLYSKAQGRIIIRSDFPEKSKGDKENTLAQWEGSLVASYMELFREETKQKGLGLQIAYTGSPHKNAAGSPMIPVFLPSASAMDMVKDELLSAFLLVMKEDGTTIDVEKSVERMLTVLTDKDQLAEALEMNVQAGRYLTIEKVVWGQIQEFRKLIENLRPADSIPDGSSVRISV